MENCAIVYPTPLGTSSKFPGGRPNVKMSSYQYRDPHFKDKTVSWPPYL